MFFDPLYLMLVIPFVILSLYASIKVQTTFKRYSQVSSSSGLTGGKTAEILLREGGLYNVTVEEGGGFLSDYYDPMKKKLSLSPDVYEGTSLASLGVAAHETGHAYQHAKGYLPLQLRAALVPAAGIGSKRRMDNGDDRIVLSFRHNASAGNSSLFTGSGVLCNHPSGGVQCKLQSRCASPGAGNSRTG